MLELLDQIARGSERLGPVRRGRSHHDRDLAGRDTSDPVPEERRYPRPAVDGPMSERGHRPLGERPIGLVVQGSHRPPAARVRPDLADEQADPSAGFREEEGDGLAEGERASTQLDRAHDL